MPRNRPSLSAAKVARGLLFLDGDARLRSVLPEGAAAMTERLLLEAGLVKPSQVRLYRKAWFTSYVRFLARHTVPGQIALIALRKRFIDEEVRSALADSTRQVLVVGAGLDTLALRLAPRYPSVSFVELDHPPTSRLKRATAEKLGLCRPNLSFVAADLSEVSPESALEATPWKPGAPSVVAAEGVLMYLKEADVVALLASLSRLAAPGSLFVFTHLGLDERGRIYMGKLPTLFRVLMKLGGEPLQWGIPRDELSLFLERNGYSLEKTPTPEELRSTYLEPAGAGDEPVGSIERLAVARISP